MECLAAVLPWGCRYLPDLKIASRGMFRTPDSVIPYLRRIGVAIQGRFGPKRVNAEAVGFLTLTLQIAGQPA